MTPPRATIHEVGPGTPGTATRTRPAPRVAPSGDPSRAGAQPGGPPIRGMGSRQPVMPHAKPAPRSVPGFIRQERLSFGYAIQGVGYCWRTQPHLRIHASVALVVLGLGLFFGISAAEWAALLAMIALVGALEMLNTVVEVVVDMVTTDYHPGAKVAKDVAAGAVLIAALGAILVGAFIFLPRLLALLR